jgi:hypothetical protein
MADSDINSDSPDNLSESQERQDENTQAGFALDEARPVCPKCLSPCHPLASYCSNCDSNQAVNPLATYMPFVNIRFNYGAFGIMWRRIWYDKETSAPMKWLYLAMIILFTPILLVFGLPAIVTRRIEDARLRNKVTIALYAVVIMLLLLFLLWSVLQPAAPTLPALPYVPDPLPY